MRATVTINEGLLARASKLAALLERDALLAHPFVIGEIARGSLSDCGAILGLLQHLPMATVAEPAAVLAYIDRHKLHGKGVGCIDSHLLALHAVARELGHTQGGVTPPRTRALDHRCRQETHRPGPRIHLHRQPDRQGELALDMAKLGAAVYRNAEALEVVIEDFV